MVQGTNHALRKISTRSMFWCKGDRWVRLITYHHPLTFLRNLETLISWNTPACPGLQRTALLSILLSYPLTRFPSNTLPAWIYHFIVPHNWNTPRSLSSPTFSPFHCPSHLPHVPLSSSILTISQSITTATRPTLSVPPHSQHYTIRHNCHTPNSISSLTFSAFHCPS